MPRSWTKIGSTSLLMSRHIYRCLGFLGHVLRLPENEPAGDFAMYVPTHGRKKPRRQRTLFTNYIHCLLGDPDNLLNDNQLLEMAQDRHRWKKLVFDCSEAEGWWFELQNVLHAVISVNALSVWLKLVDQWWWGGLQLTFSRKPKLK